MLPSRMGIKVYLGTCEFSLLLSYSTARLNSKVLLQKFEARFFSPATSSDLESSESATLLAKEFGSGINI